LWGLSQPLITKTLKISYPETDSLIVIQGNSVMAQASHLSPYQMKVLGILTGNWTKEEIITAKKIHSTFFGNIVRIYMDLKTTISQS
jgi:hypothetical protein